MKILFLHGAIKNAGDYLISYRSQALIKHIIPECEIVSLWEGTRLDSPKENKILKQCDVVVFGGGPFFTHHLYPKDIPLIPILDNIDKPMINVGGGWYGKDSSVQTIKSYHMNSASIDLLKKIQDSAGELSCRDWHTANMLRQKGFKTIMTGCPAWYDYPYLKQNTLNPIHEIKNICISDPAKLDNLQAAAKLIFYLRKRYPSAQITFIFHRGSWEQNDNWEGKKRKKLLYTVLKHNKIGVKDISGGYEGFALYDECDLHVGFRVHAHIYNLSHRNRSILIEEDGRGAGVNQALGLSSITAYDINQKQREKLYSKIKQKLYPKINKHLIDEIEFQIQKLEDTQGMEYEQCFCRMQYYYKKMESHSLKIKIMN